MEFKVNYFDIQVWYNWVVITRKRDKRLALLFYQNAYLFLHFNMNQNYDDSSGGSELVKEIKLPKNVVDTLKSWLNKAKEVGGVRNNVTIVESSDGTSDPKKIMISNMPPEKIRTI